MVKPKISIIVTSYNIEKYLGECLESILSQTFTEFECVLVDNCSTDSTPKICDEYSKKDRRIKVIHNIRNLGGAASGKIGLYNCDGEYVQYIDGDDWIEKDMLEKMWTKATSGGFDMVVCDYLYEKPGNKIYKKQEIDKMTKIDMVKGIAAAPKLCCAVWNKMIKRDILLKKIQFPAHDYMGDIFHSLQMIYYSDRIGYIEEALYHYRYNINSMTHDVNSNDKRIIGMYDNYVSIINFLKEKYGHDIDIFEPDLSTKVNSVKMDLLYNRRLRKLRNIGELYPESNKLYNGNILSRIRFFLALNRKFIALDVLTLCIRFVREIYRITVPKKTRNIIWEKRHCINGGHST
jgi:glycosyltransferase involved in cell wall biosynthesis